LSPCGARRGRHATLTSCTTLKLFALCVLRHDMSCCALFCRGEGWAPHLDLERTPVPHRHCGGGGPHARLHTDWWVGWWAGGPLAGLLRGVRGWASRCAAGKACVHVGGQAGRQAGRLAGGRIERVSQVRVGPAWQQKPVITRCADSATQSITAHGTCL